MKKYILFFFVTLAALTVKAQAGYNYYEFGVGAEVSWIRGYTNITKQFDHPAVAFKFIYNYNPYLPIEAEIQKGTLSGGGNSKADDPYGRHYTNNYFAVLVHADVHLGAAIDYEDNGFLGALKNFYLGTGFGIISNSNSVQRYSIYDPNYKFPGTDSSISPVIPIRFGYEFKIYDYYDQPAFAIDLGYIHSFAFGEGLDGYNDDPKKFKNNAIDQYRQFTLGVKYFFGNTTSYNKLIRTYNR